MHPQDLEKKSKEKVVAEGGNLRSQGKDLQVVAGKIHISSDRSGSRL